jgi:hypothetical protein
MIMTTASMMMMMMLEVLDTKISVLLLPFGNGEGYRW